MWSRTLFIDVEKGTILSLVVGTYRFDWSNWINLFRHTALIGADQFNFVWQLQIVPFSKLTVTNETGRCRDNTAPSPWFRLANLQVSWRMELRHIICLHVYTLPQKMKSFMIHWDAKETHLKKQLYVSNTDESDQSLFCPHEESIGL